LDLGTFARASFFFFQTNESENILHNKYIHGGPLKSNILNISFIFDNTKKMFQTKVEWFRGRYFGHVTFFLGGGVKKI